MAFLEHLDFNGRRQEYALTQDVVYVGRGPKSDILIIITQRLSRMVTLMAPIPQAEVPPANHASPGSSSLSQERRKL